MWSADVCQLCTMYFSLWCWKSFNVTLLQRPDLKPREFESKCLHEFRCCTYQWNVASAHFFSSLGFLWMNSPCEGQDVARCPVMIYLHAYTYWRTQWWWWLHWNTSHYRFSCFYSVLVKRECSRLKMYSWKNYLHIQFVDFNFYLLLSRKTNSLITICVDLYRPSAACDANWADASTKGFFPGLEAAKVRNATYSFMLCIILSTHIFNALQLKENCL